jgi:hypothetical protein
VVCVSVVNKNARWTQDQHSCSIWRDAVILRGPRLNEALAQPGRGLSAAALFYIILPQGNNQTGLYSAGLNLIATAPALAYKLVGSGVVYSLTREKWPIEKPPTHITHTTGRLSYILAASGRPRKVGSSQVANACHTRVLSWIYMTIVALLSFPRVEVRRRVDLCTTGGVSCIISYSHLFPILYF